jgi:signal transduction histidine kinase
MKLLNKTILYYIVFSMAIFTAGGLSFYKIVKVTIIRQVDTSLLTEKKIIEEQILYYDSIPDFTTIFGHQIEVTVFDVPVRSSQRIQDTVITNPQNETSAEYRHLVEKGNMEDGRGYRISIYKSLEDTHALFTDLFLFICLVFILVSFILIAVNYWISRKIWVPFYHALKKIKDFNINENLQLNLTPTGIREFDRLNRVLNTMSEKIRADYLNLKEFTEDASHEIQTPLSIIKSKLELLFQSEDLTDKQAEYIQAIYEATTRLSKLNHSLLLISKIQNQQYTNTGQVDLSAIIDKFLLNFQEVIDERNIRIEKQYKSVETVTMNTDLAEILISNLLGNAIRHNIEGGWVSIELTADQLVITNTGHSLAFNPNDLFKRFRKGDVSSDSAGLGLSIVNKIASLYQMETAYSLDGNVHTLTLTFNKS